MSLSKIIKASTGSRYHCFDFHDIGMASPPAGAAPGRGRQAESGAEPPQASTPDQAIERLQQELQNRLLELDRQAAEVTEAAYAKGFEKGREDGLRQGLAEVHGAAAGFEALADAMRRWRCEVMTHARGQLIEASLKIAKQLAQTELSLRPEGLARIMATALEQADDQPAMIFHLHPDDYLLLREHGALERLNAGGGQLEFREDPALSRGGCRLESPVQLFDCTLETRLALIESELTKALRDGEDDASTGAHA